MNHRDTLSKHRGAIMGIMALLIILYHAHLPTGFSLYNYTVGKYGNVGVDVFLFMSGFSVAFSLDKAPGLSRYMGRRLSRVLPTYYAYLLPLIIKRVIFEPSTVAGYALPRLIPVGVWVNNSDARWYVSAILGYYVIAALVYPMLRRGKRLYAMTALLLLVTAWYVPALSHMDNVALAVIRVPVFLIGLAAGCAAHRDEPHYRNGRLGLAGLALLFVIGAVMFAFTGRLQHGLLRHIKGESFQRLRLSLLAPLLSVALAYAFEACCRVRLGFIDRAFGWLGKYSLELYLVHTDIHNVLSRTALPAPVIVLATIAISIPAAVAVKWLAGWLLKLWQRLVARVTLPAQEAAGKPRG